MWTITACSEPPQQVNGAFLITGQSNPLIGHGLVAGHDSEGESQDVTVTVEQLKPHITWLSVEDVKGLSY